VAKKNDLKVETLKPATLPPTDPERVSTTLDAPVRSDAKQVVSEEYERFEALMKRLVRTPKSASA
jgi:hypothetical protein